MNQPVLGQQPNAQTQEDERRRQAQAGALSAMGTGAVRPVNPAQPGAQRVGTSAAARAQQTVGPAKGSGFTGVSRYMGANVGNRLGQTVTGRISGVGQQAQTQMGQAVGTFQTGVAQSQQKLQQAQTGFQQAYSGIMQGTSPYIQQQQPTAAAAAPADGVGGISGAVRAYGVAPTPAPAAKPLAPGILGGLVETDPARTAQLKQAMATVGQSAGGAFADSNEYLAKLKAAQQMAATGSSVVQKMEAPLAAPAEQPVAPVDQPVEQGVAPVEQPAAPVEPVRDAAADYAALQGGITGPAGLEGLDEIQQQTALAGQLAEATRTGGGRAALLRDAFSRGATPYTMGQTALDALVLGKSGKQLQAARKEAAALQRGITAQGTAAEQQARELESRLSAAGTEAKAAVEGGEQRFGSEIGTQREQYSKELERLTTNLTTQIASGKITKESAKVLEGLGLDPKSTQLYNLDKADLARMITSRDAGAITDASSARLDQLQKINALRRLSGQEARYTADQLAEAGKTVGAGAAMTGIGTTKDLAEVAKKGKADYEKLLEKIVPGYKGYGADEKLKTYASQFKDMGAVQRAKNEARKAEEQLKTRPVMDRSTYDMLYGKERGQKMYDDAVAARKPLMDAIQRGKDASDYLNRIQKMGAFEYSPGRGNVSQAVDVASSLFSRGLYDPTTGTLNKAMADKLLDFYKWRPEFKGKDGPFGPGIYGGYTSDVARRQALGQLISGYDKRLQVEE